MTSAGEPTGHPHAASTPPRPLTTTTCTAKLPAKLAAALWPLLAAFLLFALPARAAPDASQDQPAATSVAPIDGVDLRVVRLGVGNSARAGAWTAFLVEARDLGLTQRNVILRVSLPDSDGDIAAFDRVVATNPGARTGAQSFWLYAPLPPDAQQGSVVRVEAYEALDSARDDATGALAYRAGQRLGLTDALFNQALRPAAEGLIALVGEHAVGLAGYQAAIVGAGVDYPLKMHELATIVGGLTTPALPDRWQGWAAFDALVWSRVGEGRDPGELRPEQARAIEHWVRRGGHLIVLLPTAGQEWTTQASNRLLPILPRVRATRREGVDLAEYRELITSSPDALLPTDAVVWRLDPVPDAARGEADVLLTGRSADPLVVRRTIGAGAVTLVGLDLAHPRLRQSELPEADVLWHRILGRRGEVVTEAKVRANPVYEQWANRASNRSVRRFDDQIASEVARTGRSLQGLVLGLVLFAAYWVVAGPGGFALLAKFKRRHLSWPAFLASAALFTALAWSAAWAMRPKRAAAQYLAYVEQVDGTGLERARVFASIMIPWYGDAQISATDPAATPNDPDAAAQADGSHLIMPWRPGTTDLGGVHRFPDNRVYRADAASPSALQPPARSTVKQVRVDSLGPIRRGTIRLVSEPGQPDPTLALTAAPLGPTVTGTLEHDLPAELTDVLIFVIERQETIRPRPPGDRPVSRGRAFALRDPWAPGVPLDLALATTRAKPTDGDLAGALNTLMTTGTSVLGGLSGNPDRALSATLLLSQFPPADFREGQPDTRNTLARRHAVREHDLGRWFTQPCVIVIGQYRAASEPNSPSSTSPSALPGPVPLSVDARAIPTDGRTVLTWVYPLPASPPDWADDADDAPPGTSRPASTPTDDEPATLGGGWDDDDQSVPSRRGGTPDNPRN